MKRLGIALGIAAGLVVLAVLVLLVLGRRADAGVLNGTVQIARRPEDVFPWLNEPDKLTRWVSGLVEVRSETPGQRAVGTREVWVMDDPNTKQRVEVGGEITALEPDKLLSVRISMPGAFEGEITYTLTAAGPGLTRVDEAGRFTYHNWFASLIEPILTSQARKKLEGGLARLKEQAEGAGATER